MKPLIVVMFILSLIILPSCSDRGVESPDDSLVTDLGKVSLSFASAPSEIARVVATISRPNFAARSITMFVNDTARSASGSFSEVAIGIWHLRVEAFNDSNIVRYAGETDVDVRGGQIAQVSLHLLPTSGGINIVVTWGTPSVTTGLMAYYPFNGNANDASGRGNNGVVSGAIPTFDRRGAPNSAYFFDGVNDNITIASSPSLHPFNQLTITFWIRVDSIHNNHMPVIHKGGQAISQPWLANREYAVYLKQNYSACYFLIYSAGNEGGQHEVNSTSFFPHRWIFFAAVYDRQTHRMKSYLDGVLNQEVNDSYSSFNVNNYPLTIGTEAETVWPDHSPFFGALDELRLYNRALSAEEIRALYDGQ
jgi:hypothetical protein